MIYVFLLGFMSPTLFLAAFLKKGSNKNKVIRSFNWLYFGISIASFLIMLIFMIIYSVEEANKISTLYPLFVWLWMVFLLSRCFEIFYAFLRDALDKITGKSSVGRVNFPTITKYYILWIKLSSDKGEVSKLDSFLRYLLNLKIRFLSWLPFKDKVNGADLRNHDRLILSFRSYFELILNFALIYSLLPADNWSGEKILNIIQATYFSGVTITTLGYGDIYPKQWFSQFLSIFEVLCGFTLIVVCLAIYLKDDPDQQKKDSLTSLEPDKNQP
ncbi:MULTISPECIES: potassium channel family protein [Marinomonas]|uniref:Potassium channel family protein n=1 Tax=Marinomonas rhodophyticola TaxID=2992803 RepID=A0ABT3KGK1_9GAMM|nr:potassium channel family protein [Marinomonas sp. KJ51-3]MCW4629673.1 potassium channel family protein [Marinomonas sp. KJ51-3]